jgi:hypothetical protein
MKVGDLVKYKPHPHRSLQHLLGLVTSFVPLPDDYLPAVYVIWGQDRPRGPSGTLMFEYMDELEVIGASNKRVKKRI